MRTLDDVQTMGRDELIQIVQELLPLAEQVQSLEARVRVLEAIEDAPSSHGQTVAEAEPASVSAPPVDEEKPPISSSDLGATMKALTPGGQIDAVGLPAILDEPDGTSSKLRQAVKRTPRWSTVQRSSHTPHTRLVASVPSWHLQSAMAQPLQQARQRIANATQQWYWWPVVAVSLLTILAIILRWWAIPDFDNRMFSDEASTVLDARRFLTGELSDPFTNDQQAMPAMYDFLLAQVFRVTGVSVAVAREFSGVWGALGVPLLYGIARELGIRRSTAFAAAAILATASWHLHVSRLALTTITGATMVELVVYCSIVAIRRQTRIWAGAVGVSLALMMYFYLGGRVVVPILILWIASLFLIGGPLKRTVVVPASISTSSSLNSADPSTQVLSLSFKSLRNLSAIALLVAFILCIPLVYNFARDPSMFLDHSIGVSAFSQAQMQWLLALNPQITHGIWGVALYQFQNTIGMFTAQGPLAADENMPGRPLLDSLSSLLLLVGLLTCLWTWRRPLSMLLLIWVVVVYVMGALMTIHPPSGMRPIPIAPALALVIALGIETVLALLVWLWARLGQVALRGDQQHQASLPMPEPIENSRNQPASKAGNERQIPGLDLLTRLALLAVVILIGIVNIGRTVDYESSQTYGAFMASSAIAWGRYLGQLGAVTADIATPLGYAGNYQDLFASRATICVAQWTNTWRQCPASHVVIFDVGAGADAARYAARTHRVAHAGPAPFGTTLFWYVRSVQAPLPDPAVVLGRVPAMTSIVAPSPPPHPSKQSGTVMRRT